MISILGTLDDRECVCCSKLKKRLYLVKDPDVLTSTFMCRDCIAEEFWLNEEQLKELGVTR